MSLAEALGYGKEDKLLLVNADDFGLSHAVNLGVRQLLEEQAISSATLMMPCGWAPDAAGWSVQNPQYDVGIHFTFTSEWDIYRWGPVNRSSSSASLVDGHSYFPKDARTFELQAGEGEVRAELIAQLEMALAMGLKPSHADNHMGSLYGIAAGRSFLPAVLDVCASYGLPFRLPRYVTPQTGQVVASGLAGMAQQAAALADAKGVVIIDYLISLPFHLGPGETYSSVKADMQHMLRGLHAGVTELIIHPAQVTDEFRAFHPEHEKRGMELELLRDDDVLQTLQEEGIRLIRWSELQQLQRSG